MALSTLIFSVLFAAAVNIIAPFVALTIIVSGRKYLVLGPLATYTTACQLKYPD